MPCSLAVGGLLDNDRKLIAARARHGVGSPNTRGKHGRHLLQHQVAHMVAKCVVHAFEVVQIDHKQSCLRLGATCALQSLGQPVLKEPAVGQSGQIVMQRQMPGLFDLVFQQQQDHAHRHHILGQIPYFALDLNLGQICLHQRSDHKDRRPGQESGDGNKGAGRAAVVHKPEVEAAAEENRKQDGIDCQVCAVSRPILKDQKKRGKRSIEGHNRPAEAIVEFLQRCQRDQQRRGAKQGSAQPQGPGGSRDGSNQCEVERIGSRQRSQHPVAGGDVAVGNCSPHEEQPGPDQRHQSDDPGHLSQRAGKVQEQECGKVQGDHDPAGQPDSGNGCGTALRHRCKRTGQKGNCRQIG